MTLNDIKARCRIDGKHWIWTGARSQGYPRIWAPDYTLHDGKKRVQHGRRAVWHVKTGQPIPDGFRVFGTCDIDLCLAPGCMVCRAVAEQGALVAESGHLKGAIARITANRKIGRSRSVVTDEMRLEIIESEESGLALAARLGVSPQTISMFRTHQRPSFEPVGSAFSGLLR